jgi:hypothetical protein
MNGIFGKKRSVDELLADPDFLSLAYHLAGAAEMASVVLAQKEESEVQEIGRVLGAISSQFFDRSGLRRATPIPPT